MLHTVARTTFLLAASAILWHLAASPAAAQYTYLPGQPYPVSGGVAPAYGGYPGYYPPGYGWGGYGNAVAGYWYGSAAVLDAYSNMGVSQEQARILREQANQAKLDTKKKAIDVMAYERANKYWYSDEVADINAKKIQFALNNPPTVEVTSGRALNTLLPYLDQMLSTGVRGPTIPVEPIVVKSLNVTSGANNGNVGLLRDIDNLPWPTSLLGKTQESLNTMLKEATYTAFKGPVPPPTITKLNKTTDALEQEVKTRFHKSEIDGGEYLEGTRFIARVRDAINALRQPNASMFLSGAFGPRGDTVDEVVYSMASKGLTFAPAQPGQEFAYIALHRGFVNFVAAAGTPDSGFRVMAKGAQGPKMPPQQ
jgi:hypothetical protein